MMRNRRQQPFVLDPVIRFYRENAQRERSDIKIVAWGSQRSQERRFKVLSEVANLQGRSVLDVGCGVGDFYGWAIRKKMNIKYIGIDITPEVIIRAKQKYPKGNFRVQQILNIPRPKPMYDYVIASGIFNRKISKHKTFVEETIKRMFLLCKKGVAFNILSTKADFKEPNEYYANPGELLNKCLILTRHAILRHDYMTHDFTIYLYRQ